MRQRAPDGKDIAVAAGLAELRSLIAARYPEAQFTVFEGEDPAGVYLRAVVDVEDSGEILTPALDRLYELQVEQELPIYLVATQPSNSRFVPQVNGQPSSSPK